MYYTKNVQTATRGHRISASNVDTVTHAILR